VSVPFLDFIATVPAKQLSCLARYRSRLNLIYPRKEVQETCTINFVPSEDEEEDEFFVNLDTGIHSHFEDLCSQLQNWPPRKGGLTLVQLFVNIQWNGKLGSEYAKNNLLNLEPTMMPQILKPEALHLISRLGPFFINLKEENDFSNVHQIHSNEVISR
jgi:hypothetical protein